MDIQTSTSQPQFAPIVIFGFNRLNNLKKLIESLQTNPEYKDSDLYIYIDGPRNENDIKDVGMVQEYVRSVNGFKKITCQFSNKNKGLGLSIITGVSEVIKKHGSAIILEDDLVVLPNFLSFMNQGLQTFKDIRDIWSVCGYTNKISIPKDYEFDTYFCTRSSSWGWATWEDRWNSVDWELEPWGHYHKYKRKFNQWGGSDCFGMLENWKNGKNRSWAIRFCFAQFLQNKISLFPIKSLVINDGFDGKGSNCKKWSRFKYELMPNTKVEFSYPSDITLNKLIYQSAMRYNSFPLRIYSKIMYLLTSLK